MTGQAILSFRIDGREVDTYVHDGDGLGTRIQRWMLHVSPFTAKAWARGLRVVEPDSHPSEYDQHALMGWADVYVSSESLTDWYCLLCRTQGDPDAILRAGVVVQCEPETRPFVRWRFLLDLDAPALEVWHRPPWVFGTVPDFERVASLHWSCAATANLDALAEAVLLLQEGERR